MTIFTTLKLIGGLIALVGGGDLLIRGASNIAAKFGVSPLVIGLTVVAFGTSAPELVVSLQSSFSGHNNMAIANIVGSNIFNVLLILGACAAFKPLVISSQLVRLDVPLMAGSSILLYLFSLNGYISTFEGFILFLILVGYTVFLIIKSRSEVQELNPDKNSSQKNGMYLNVALVIVGLFFLVKGGEYFISSAVEIATYLGVSETVIGLTIVAGGTSLPEVATSLIATMKGERDIAIGNVVGSNIFNILLIVGLSSIISPVGLMVSPDILSFDLPLMIATCIACLPIFLAGFQVTRLDGFVFLLSYASYIAFIVFQSTEHSFFSNFQNGVYYFVIPAIAFSLIGSTYQAIKTVKERGLRNTPSR